MGHDRLIQIVRVCHMNMFTNRRNQEAKSQLKSYSESSFRYSYTISLGDLGDWGGMPQTM